MVNERKKKRDEEENFLSDPEIKALVGEAEVRKIMLTVSPQDCETTGASVSIF